MASRVAIRDPGVFVATFLVTVPPIVWALVSQAAGCHGLPNRRIQLWVHRSWVVTFLVGAFALKTVEARIAGAGVARRVYATACGIGAFGVFLLAVAPDPIIGSAGVLLATGISSTVTRAVGVIWVNSRTTSDVRATVHSFLAQVEYFGENSLRRALVVLVQATQSPALSGGKRAGRIAEWWLNTLARCRG